MPALPDNRWWRAWALAVLLAAELLAFTVAYDAKDVVSRGGIVAEMASYAALVLRFGLALVGSVVALGWPTWRKESPAMFTALTAFPVRWRMLAGHFLLVAVAAISTNGLVGSGHPLWLIAMLSSGAGSAWLAVRGLVDERVIRSAAGKLGSGWILAVGIAVGAAAGGDLARSFWEPSARVTYQLVGWLLRPFVNGVISNPAELMIGTGTFAVTIAPECSGYEGVALVLLFSSGWLWYLRREYRFPGALAIVPVAAGLIWLLNSVRIASLILVGHYISPGIALGGFHSQAGWIAFLAVAMGLCLWSSRVPGLAARSSRGVEVPTEDRPVAADPAPYLIPFLAILTVSILTRAMSGSFEWLYPLRVVVCGWVLWHFRKQYAEIRWRFGWPAVAAGFGVFVLWIWFDRSATSGRPAELSSVSVVGQWAWLALRIVGAAITVPVAEELAFRGFLMRRLVQADFTAVPWERWAWLPVLASSVAFGAMHGGRWIEGTIAGLVYAGVMARTGRLGEAAAAHGITNALLACWVLTTGQWQLW